MENEKTTMAISRGTLNKLDKIRAHPRIPYEEVIIQLADFYNRYRFVVEAKKE